MLPLNQAKQSTTEDAAVENPSILSMTDMKDIIKDMKKISNSTNVKGVVESLDVERKREKFYTKISNILVKFDLIDIKQEQERVQIIFLFVLQAASDYLSNDHKKEEICLQLLKRFMKDDELLTRNIMLIVQSKVKPFTFYRKNKHRIARFVGFFLAIFSKAI